MYSSEQNVPRWLPTNRSRTCQDDFIPIGAELDEMTLHKSEQNLPRWLHNTQAPLRRLKTTSLLKPWRYQIFFFCFPLSFSLVFLDEDACGGGDRCSSREGVSVYYCNCVFILYIWNPHATCGCGNMCRSRLAEGIERGVVNFHVRERTSDDANTCMFYFFRPYIHMCCFVHVFRSYVKLCFFRTYTCVVSFWHIYALLAYMFMYRTSDDTNGTHIYVNETPVRSCFDMCCFGRTYTCVCFVYV
jgi:hypothetical protein